MKVKAVQRLLFQVTLIICSFVAVGCAGYQEIARQNQRSQTDSESWDGVIRLIGGNPVDPRWTPQYQQHPSGIIKMVRLEVDYQGEKHKCVQTVFLPFDRADHIPLVTMRSERFNPEWLFRKSTEKIKEIGYKQDPFSKER